MIIRIKKDLKDLVQAPKHRTYSRREFIEKGIATTTLAAAVPGAIATGLAKDAMAATALTCPTPTANGTPGGVGQLHLDGGSTMASYILTANQLNIVQANSSAASLYGITGGGALSPCFANGGVALDAPFGATLLTPPPGISAAAWKAALLQVAVGANFGAASADDGNGANQGHIGAISPYKVAANNTDIIANSGVTLASFAQGLGGQTTVRGDGAALTTASLAASFGIQPSTLTNATLFANTAAAATSLGSIFSSIFGAARTGAQTGLTSAACAFQNDAVMASSAYGTGLFTVPAAAIANSGLTVGGLSAMEQAYLGGFYASNIGSVGSVAAVDTGADYHGQSVQNTIAPFDQNVALQVRAWLLAAMLAQTPSVLFLTTNGFAGAAGTQPATITINGTTVNVNGPSAQGDQGGDWSAHFMLTYSPNGKTPPVLTSTGSIAGDGRATVDGRITSVPQSIAGLYLTGMKFLGLTTTGFTNVLAAKGIVPITLI